MATDEVLPDELERIARIFAWLSMLAIRAGLPKRNFDRLVNELAHELLMNASLAPLLRATVEDLPPAQREVVLMARPKVGPPDLECPCAAALRSMRVFLAHVDATISPGETARATLNTITMGAVASLLVGTMRDVEERSSDRKRLLTFLEDASVESEMPESGGCAGDAARNVVAMLVLGAKLGPPRPLR